MVNIPYLGSAPSLQALVAGQVDLLIDSVGVLFPVYKAGLVKVLAITAAKRISELPGIPTLAEFGLGKRRSLELVRRICTAKNSGVDRRPTQPRH